MRNQSCGSKECFTFSTEIGQVYKKKMHITFLDATVEADISLGTGFSLTTYVRPLSSYQGRLDRLDGLDTLDRPVRHFIQI